MDIIRIIVCVLSMFYFQVILMSATLDDTTKVLRRCLVKSGDWVRVELPEEAFLPSDTQLTQYIIRQVVVIYYLVYSLQL